jgi:site-specific recombinase XerD
LSRHLKFHDLRHTTAANLRRAGVDIFNIKQITGHKTLAMLERYNTIDVEDLHEAMDKVAKNTR